ncbi:MAG: DUF4372 domain-containing protein [Candidatus Sabulitectum sp.]|nr:DUF4372 domain-containing protein [Candidatus Sabulitectum sp.]
MVRCASLFNQLLQQFPKQDFQRLVNKHQTKRNAKGFSSWSQFVSMLFCHFARADSLREISYGLTCCIGKLSQTYALGIECHGNGCPSVSIYSYSIHHGFP